MRNRAILSLSLIHIFAPWQRSLTLFGRLCIEALLDVLFEVRLGLGYRQRSQRGQ